MENKKYIRKRNLTIAFRVTPKENELINKYVSLSGLTKQDYLTSNMLRQNIVVNGNPRVFRALQKQLYEIVQELKRINNPLDVNQELIELLKYIADLVDRLNSS